MVDENNASAGTRPDHPTGAGTFEFKSNGQAIAIGFTEQRPSPHTGSARFWGWLRPLDWRKTLAKALPHPPPLSNNQLLPVEKALAFMRGLPGSVGAPARSYPVARRACRRRLLPARTAGVVGTVESALWGGGASEPADSKAHPKQSDLDGDRGAGDGSGPDRISSVELTAPALAGAAPTSRQRRRGVRRQTPAGRAEVSLSSPGDEPTPSTHPPPAVWRYYPGRADCENGIKELPAGCALPTLCRNSSGPAKPP